KKHSNLEQSKHTSISMWKGSTHGPSCRNQPNFIDIPVRTNSIHIKSFLLIIFTKESRNNTSSKINTFQNKETNKQNHYQYKPKFIKKQFLYLPLHRKDLVLVSDHVHLHDFSLYVEQTNKQKQLLKQCTSA